MTDEIGFHDVLRRPQVPQARHEVVAAQDLWTGPHQRLSENGIKGIRGGMVLFKQRDDLFRLAACAETEPRLMFAGIPAHFIAQLVVPGLLDHAI